MKPSTSVPAEAVNIYNAALDFSNRGDVHTALNQYQKAISVYPRFMEAYNNIGEIYSKLGDRDKAVDTYKQALSIDRNHKVLLNIGVEYYNSGKYQTALTHFKESISSREDFIEGQFYTAISYHRMRDNVMAEKHLRKVIEMDNRHLKANYLLASMMYERADYAGVLTCLDRIKNIADDRAFVSKYYGFCMYHMGKYNEAVSYLSEALELSPQYSRFKEYLKTVTYEHKKKEIGDIPASISVMERRLAEGKMSLQDYTHLSMLYIFDGQNEKAEQLLLPLRDKLKKAC